MSPPFETNTDFDCRECKDTGVVQYKPITEMTDYRWVPWETRKCQCQEVNHAKKY